MVISMLLNGNNLLRNIPLPQPSPRGEGVLRQAPLVGKSDVAQLESPGIGRDARRHSLLEAKLLLTHRHVLALTDNQVVHYLDIE
jgi:hypothetical protein